MPLHSHLLLVLPFQGHLDQLPKSFISIPYLQNIRVICNQPHSDLCGQSSQASGAMGRAPLGCCAPTQEVKGPFQDYCHVRGFTTGHKPPEAFCHLPSYRGPGSLHSQPWGEILLRPEPCSLRTAQPYHHPRPRLSLPSLSQRLSTWPQPVSEAPDLGFQ